MSKLLNLPGTGSSSRKDGYHALEEPVKSHTVSAGGIQQEIELGDLANHEFYDQVAAIRESIRQYDARLTLLQPKQISSLQPNDAPTAESISVELTSLNSELSLVSNELRKQVGSLGDQVGRDEARRGHWENLRSSLKRAVERQQKLEMEQRERVRERVKRQYLIVKPDATEEEVKELLSTSSSSTAPQIFSQALTSSQRTTAALSALNEAKSRQTELASLESSLIELSRLIQQVADLVVQQDPQVIKIASNAEGIEGDLEKGLKGVQKARLSALGSRHKRKICAAIGLTMLAIIVVVVVVQFKGSGGVAPGGETKVEDPAKEAEAKQEWALDRGVIGI